MPGKVIKVHVPMADSKTAPQTLRNHVAALEAEVAALRNQIAAQQAGGKSHHNFNVPMTTHLPPRMGTDSKGIPLEGVIMPRPTFIDLNKYNANHDSYSKKLWTINAANC